MVKVKLVFTPSITFLQGHVVGNYGHGTEVTVIECRLPVATAAGCDDALFDWERVCDSELRTATDLVDSESDS
jgi:hypothetical protein